MQTVCDHTVLTFGCDACITRRTRDQAHARWATAPIRRCRWTWHDPTDDREVHFTLDVRVPADADSWEVDEQYAGDTGSALTQALIAKYPKATTDDIVDLTMRMLDRILRVTIGEIVHEPAAADTTEALF